MFLVLGNAGRALPVRAAGGNLHSAAPAGNYPTDPTGNFGWSAGLSSTDDIQSAFNQARSNENSQLGLSLPAMTLPAQAVWDALSDGGRAAWLINRERIDRGVMPLQGEEPHVTAVAQNFAQYLFSHNAFAHDADGGDPWQRLNADPTIRACHDSLNVAENLSVFATTGNSIPLGLERAIYLWLYGDGDCCGWGHRHAVLWYPYNDNSGPSGREGFLGIGRVSGGPYQGPFSRSYPLAQIIVLNLFDPCSTWNYNLASAFNLYLPLLLK